ncbi:MAG: hypothetical protein SGI97_02825 [candidate division Zixibacteria bacterium]|nr:hypothetical protein [candidate division Zixibacteria bacterium]
MARIRKPATAKVSDVMIDEITRDAVMGNLSTAEARREYQRRYYQMHKEKAKEYQRQYNLTHKKKARGGRGKSGFSAQREAVRSTFNTADIMHSPVEKTLRMLEKIINGERLFTM